MVKSVVVAAVASLAIAGSSFVYAQQRFEGPDGFRDGRSRMEFRHRMSAQDVTAFTDARIAALKAGLELTPDQQKNWPAFETALRDMAQLRIDRIKARDAGAQQPPASPFDRLARRADTMNKASAALKQVADAGAPLYASLDDAQKGRFTMLAHMLRPHRMGGFGGGWREGRGWRHDDDRFGDNDGRDGGMHHHMSDEDGDSQL